MRAEPYVGLMSGTSLDGIDAVAVSFEGACPEVLGQASLPFPPELRTELLNLNRPRGQDELERAAAAGVALAQTYAEAALAAAAAAGLRPDQVAAIGCHGQTVRHRPERGYTVQLGNGAWLAELTGITVVTDFRSRDIAAGGQGAPLVPAFHEAVFAGTRPRAILNLGGISNLTLLCPGKPPRGYDCGPGNVLLDGWSERHLGVPFDRDGAWAQGGTPDPVLLSALLEHPHFRRAPPKSTGRDEFHLPWLDSHDAVGRLAPRDVQATLLALTARAAADCILAESAEALPEAVYCCGGGALNGALLDALQAALPGLAVTRTEALGLPVQRVEAVAFAWLARELLQGRPASRPSVTGARHSALLGAVYPA